MKAVIIRIVSALLALNFVALLLMFRWYVLAVGKAFPVSGDLTQPYLWLAYVVPALIVIFICAMAVLAYREPQRYWLSSLVAVLLAMGVIALECNFWGDYSLFSFSGSIIGCIACTVKIVNIRIAEKSLRESGTLRIS